MIKLNKQILGFGIAALVVVGGIFIYNNGSGEYKDGTYRVECDDFDKQGWKPFLEMTFEDGLVTDVVFNYNHKEDGRLKTEDDAYNNRMMSKVGVNPRIYTKELAVELIVEQSNEDFDGVSGASHSTKEVEVMSGILFDKARKGDTKTEVIPLIP